MDLEQFPTSSSAKRMLSSVSEEFYAKSYVAKWLYEVMGREWDAVWEIVNAIPEQAFVETATWGLAYHEIKWGLPVRENLDYATRRRLIYEKRDVKKPVNPWAMERIVTDISGRGASVRDSNDDPDIPTNTFILQIESGESSVDLSAIIRKIRAIKQSHVDFSIRVCARASLTLNTQRTPWRKRFIITGTVPKTSRGLRLTDGLIALQTNPAAIRMNYPESGNSGNAGLYPKTSRALEIQQSNVRVLADAEQFESRFPITSDALKAGTKPIPSRILRMTDTELTARGKTDSSRKEFTLSGVKPELSQGLELRNAGMEVSAETESHAVEFTLAGTSPKQSRRVKERPTELDVTLETESREVFFAVAGDGRTAGTAPGQSRAMLLETDDLTVSAHSEAVKTAATLAGQGSGKPLPFAEGTTDAGVSVTTKTYGTRVKICGSGFSL